MLVRRTLLSWLLLWLVLAVPAPVAAAEFEVDFLQERPIVTLQVNASQNLTGFNNVQVLPSNLKVMMSGSNASSLVAALRRAIQAKSPAVAVESADLTLTSGTTDASCVPICLAQWFNASLKIQLDLNPTIRGDSAQYDLSWKSFKVNDDITAEGRSLNMLGENYLLSAIQPFVTFPNTPSRTMIVSVNNFRTNPDIYTEPVSNIVLFDLSNFSAPLASWNHRFDIGSDLRTWTSPSASGFDILANLRIVEGDEVFVLNYYAQAKITAEVVAPFDSQVQGDTLIISYESTLYSQAFSAIIGASIAMGLLTVLIERRVTKKWRESRRVSKNR